MLLLYLVIQKVDKIYFQERVQIFTPFTKALRKGKLSFAFVLWKNFYVYMWANFKRHKNFDLWDYVVRRRDRQFLDIFAWNNLIAFVFGYLILFFIFRNAWSIAYWHSEETKNNDMVFPIYDLITGAHR